MPALRQQGGGAALVSLLGYHLQEERVATLHKKEHKRFMSRNRLLIIVFVVFVLSSLLVPSVRSQSPVSQPAKSSRAGEQERALARGKQIFVAKCASCHAEAGDKPLQSGPPLNLRELSAEDITKFVSGRLKDSPDEEKRAVALYVQSIMKR